MKKLLIFVCIILLTACNKTPQGSTPQETDNKEENFAEELSSDNCSTFPNSFSCKSRTRIIQAPVQEENRMTAFLDKDLKQTLQQNKRKNLDEYIEDNTSYCDRKSDNIMDACERLDIKKVKELIKSGTDVNCVTLRKQRVGACDSGVCGDGYEYWQESPLHKMRTREEEIKEDLASWRRDLYWKSVPTELEKNSRILFGAIAERHISEDGLPHLRGSDEEIQAHIEKDLKEYEKVSEIIKLLQSADAKGIYRKVKR